MSSRLHRAVLALAILAVAVPAPAVLGQSGPCTLARPKMRSDQWTEISVPEPTVGEHVVKDFAAMPFAMPGTRPLFVTNGHTVQRSLDGGCLWEEVYVPVLGSGETQLPGPELVIDAIEVAPSPRALSRVYLLVHDEHRAYAVVSTDLGNSWDATSVGLPPDAAGGALKVTPDPLVAYAVLNSPTSLGHQLLGNGRAGVGRLYVTRDGGAQWLPVNTEIAPEPFDDLVLDAADPRVLFVWNETSMFASGDRGATFRRVSQVRPPISTADVYRFPPASPARVLAFRGDQRAAFRSSDGGQTWRTVPMPGVVHSAAHAFTVDVYAMSSDRGVHVGGVASTTPVDITPDGVTPTNLQFNHQSPITLYGQAGRKLYSRFFYDTYLPPPPPPKLPKLPPVNLRGGAIADIADSTLTPPATTIALLPGQSRTVRYQLDLAPTPTPLDIFFATDSTGSMDDLIGGLRASFQDIVNSLGAAGIDVRFGLADFRDYPIPGFGGPDDYPYRLLRPIGRIDEELKDAIEEIEPGGGLNLDSALAAAYQAATGEGQDKLPVSGTGDQTGRWIEPTNPRWRSESLKVIVLAADVRGHDPESDPGYPGPSFATVIRALNRKNIEFVGLAVGDGSIEHGDPYDTLSRVAAGTHTVAPEKGADCDGNGRAEIAPGKPLVCRLGDEKSTADGVGPALVNLLTSVTDLNTVGLQITGDDRVARHVSAPAYDDVNVKISNRLLFDVAYTCGPETAGESYPVTLRARSGDLVVAAATANVTCILPDGPRAVFQVPPPVAAAAVPPPPPPAPIPQAQPNPNPNPNPNPQFQPAAQGQPGYGMAAEEQEQASLALAYDEVTETELAMTGLALAGLVMTGVAGAVATRSRGVPATARGFRPR